MKPLNGQSGTDGFAVADSLLKILDVNSIGSLVSLGADVVILDLVMPGLDGLGVLKAMGERGIDLRLGHRQQCGGAARQQVLLGLHQLRGGLQGNHRAHERRRLRIETPHHDGRPTVMGALASTRAMAR